MEVPLKMAVRYGVFMTLIADNAYVQREISFLKYKSVCCDFHSTENDKTDLEFEREITNSDLSS